MLLAVLVLGIMPLISEAQFSESLNPVLALTLQPAYPSPEEEVTVSLEDYRGGAPGTEISWFLDGKPISSAYNERTVTVTAGKAGTKNIIKAVLTAPNGSVESVSATLAPVYLDIIVEPQTHVPDFYQGRALPSIGSTVNLTALLDNGNSMATRDLMFNWTVNQQVLEGGAIRGRNRTSFTVPQGTNLVITLQVTTLDGTVVARRSHIVPSVLPELHFYEMNTLYGTGRRSLTNGFNLIGNSATIKAEPYYLDSRIFNNPNISTWNINGNEVAVGGSNPYEITIERTGEVGLAELGFHVRSTSQVLQGAKGKIKVNY
jgi:hypothetical protein